MTPPVHVMQCRWAKLGVMRWSRRKKKNAQHILPVTAAPSAVLDKWFSKLRSRGSSMRQVCCSYKQRAPRQKTRTLLKPGKGRMRVPPDPLHRNRVQDPETCASTALSPGVAVEHPNSRLVEARKREAAANSLDLRPQLLDAGEALDVLLEVDELLAVLLLDGHSQLRAAVEEPGDHDEVRLLHAA